MKYIYYMVNNKYYISWVELLGILTSSTLKSTPASIDHDERGGEGFESSLS